MRKTNNLRKSVKGWSMVRGSVCKTRLLGSIPNQSTQFFMQKSRTSNMLNLYLNVSMRKEYE